MAMAQGNLWNASVFIGKLLAMDPVRQCLPGRPLKNAPQDPRLCLFFDRPGECPVGAKESYQVVNSPTPWGRSLKVEIAPDVFHLSRGGTYSSYIKANRLFAEKLERSSLKDKLTLVGCDLGLNKPGSPTPSATPTYASA
jgi:hypothetical protein